MIFCKSLGCKGVLTPACSNLSPWVAKYSWEQTMVCNICQIVNVVCSLCVKPIIFTSKKQCCYHQQYHSKKQKLNHIASLPSASCIVSTKLEKTIELVNTNPWLSKESKSFLLYQNETNYLSAICRITAMAAFNSKDIASVVLKDIKVSDAALILCINRLVLLIGRSSQHLLEKVFILLLHNTTQRNSSLPIPLTVQEFRATFYNYNNQTSLHSLLPTPKVVSLKNNMHMFHIHHLFSKL